MVAARRNRRERQKADIRAELLTAAHALVREGGYEALTIRRLADSVGYATMSVYSYFPDKHSILLALARDAFAELARRMELDRPADPIEALRSLMRAYIEFGLENPNEYRTVFMGNSPAHDEGKTPEEMKQENPALQLLLARVAACIDAGHFRGDVDAMASMMWTVGHGTVALYLSFPHYPFGDPRIYSERMMDLVVDGLRAREIPPHARRDTDC